MSFSVRKPAFIKGERSVKIMMRIYLKEAICFTVMVKEKVSPEKRLRQSFLGFFFFL